MRATLQAVTDRQFDQVIETSTVPVLVEFWRPACGQCRALTAEFEQGVQQRGFLMLNAFHFSAYARPAHELFDQLIMCVHV
jgi:thioredoxin-like negative regulator of GroEL